MHHYSQGKPTRQAHKGIPEDHYEEEQGLKGFFGPVSHLIKRKPSTGWTNIEGPLKPRMFDLVKIEGDKGVQRLLYNNFLTISKEWVSPSAEAHTMGRRNADGDLIYFCHEGSGELWSEYGLLPYSKGQYTVVPKSLTHSIVAKERSSFLIIENRASHYEEPNRGIAGRNALYDVNAIGKPDLEAMHTSMAEKKSKVTEVHIKHSDEVTKFFYDDCVYGDVIGWKGDLYPYSLHMDHIMPLMSHRAHLPPSAHSTFVARDFVVCSFLPRPLETDEDALKVPFYHQNIDYDEVIFYHDGDFFSRDNLHAGMMSFHPAGFPHGPHPKAVKSIGTKTETSEYAVMIDSRWPLKQDSTMSDIEVKDYWKSWKA